MDNSDIEEELFEAIFFCNVERFIQLMQSYGIDVNARFVIFDRINKPTLLHLAARRCHIDSDCIDILKYLLSHGADPNAKDNKHQTPLHYAADNGCYEAVKWLVKHGADINATDDVNRTPLHYAVENVNVEVVKYLILKRANTIAQDNSGFTPLHLLVTSVCKEHDEQKCEKMKEEIVQSLGRNKAVFYIRDNNNETPLERARKYDKTLAKIMEEILKEEVKPEREFKSLELFNSLDIEYIQDTEQQSSQEFGRKFNEVFPDLCNNVIHEGSCYYDLKKLCESPTYKHQDEAIQILLNGGNVILKASTGSGKTEIWVTYALAKQRQDKSFKVLAIYPTKALASDQINRIVCYYKDAGFDVKEEEKKKAKFYYGAVLRYDGDVSNYIRKKHIEQALTVLTNPEILLNAMHSINYKLRDFLSQVKMIVIDELDFYDSTGATVLLYLVKRLIESRIVNENVQIVILGATISNIKVIQSIFQNIQVVSGTSFKPPNYLYVILGKKANFESLWKQYGQQYSYEEFKKRFFELVNADPKIHSAAMTLLRDNQSIVEDLLERYKNCKETTLVFAKSIDDADKYCNSLGISCHHSRISKDEREKVEKGLREGSINIAISVKTLAQGVDIGSVTRIVHLGLPRDVKEFIQKEGRKGRRKDIPYTESVIIPLSESDLIILKDLNKWLELGPESLIIDFNNDILKLYDEYMDIGQNNVDTDFIRELLLCDQKDVKISVPKTLREACEKGLKGAKLGSLGFYNILPERDSIPVYIYKNNKCEFIDRIGIREYVERFQPGCIDNYSASMVGSIWATKFNKPKPAILKFAILPNFDFSFYFNYNSYTCQGSQWTIRRDVINAIDKALEKYVKLCYEWGYYKWGDEPDLYRELYRDVTSYKLWSKVYTTLLFSGTGGFKLVNEVPVSVRWYVESRNRRTKLINGIQVTAYDVESIDLNYPPRAAPYIFFTYVYANDLDPRDRDFGKIWRGLGFIKAILRYKYGISLDLIQFSYEPQSNLLKIWESEPVGLLKRLRNGETIEISRQDKIEQLNCDKLKGDIQKIDVDEKMKLLLQYIDDFIFSDKELQLNLGGIRTDAERMRFYLCNITPAKIKDKTVEVSTTPKDNILIIDKLGDKWSIVMARKDGNVQVLTMGTEQELESKNLYKILLQIDIDRINAIVYYLNEEDSKKLREKLDRTKLSRLVDSIVDLRDYVEKFVGEPLSLDLIRREVIGREDLIELMNELEIKIYELQKAFEKEKVQQELDELYKKIFEMRGKTIGILYNLSTLSA